MKGQIGCATTAEVLLVEDTAGDIRLAREAFRGSARGVQLHVACDGIEAMSFLKREGTYAIAPRPDLIVLDINIPRMNGWEVLRAIKTDENLKVIPTIILTTSDAEADVFRSYQLEANCYLRKPEHWDAFDNIIRSISAFWLTNAKLPQEARASEVTP